MKKMMTLLLGMSIALGAVAFAQNTDTTKTTAKKSAKKSTKKSSKKDTTKTT